MGLNQASNDVKQKNEKSVITLAVSKNAISEEITKISSTFPIDLKNSISKDEITLSELITVLQKLQELLSNPATVNENAASINTIINELINAILNNNLEKEQANELNILFQQIFSIQKNTDDPSQKAARFNQLNQFLEKILTENHEAAIELLLEIRKKIRKQRSDEDQTDVAGKPKGINLKVAGTYLALGGLAIFGLLKGATEGFNGINSLISVIPGLAGTPLALACCIAFIGVSVLIYIGFDYRNISKALGVKFLQARGAATHCLEQTEQLEQIYDELQRAVLEEKIDPSNEQTYTDLLCYKNIVDQQIIKLNAKKDALEKSLPNPTVKMIAKGTTFVLGGILFLCGGFFGGQSFFMTILGLPIASPLIIGLSIAVAIGAFTSYAVLEGSQSSEFVEFLLGTSEESINKIKNSLNSLEIKQNDVNQLLKLSLKPVTVIPEQTQENLNSQPVFHTNSSRNQGENHSSEISNDSFLSSNLISDNV